MRNKNINSDYQPMKHVMNSLPCTASNATVLRDRHGNCLARFDEKANTINAVLKKGLPNATSKTCASVHRRHKAL